MVPVEWVLYHWENKCTFQVIISTARRMYELLHFQHGYRLESQQTQWSISWGGNIYIYIMAHDNYNLVFLKKRKKEEKKKRFPSPNIYICLGGEAKCEKIAIYRIQRQLACSSISTCFSSNLSLGLHSVIFLDF